MTLMCITLNWLCMAYGFKRLFMYRAAGVLLLILFACAAVWGGLHPTKPPNHPIGFGPQWQCTGSDLKGAGFCMRAPPMAPTKP